ncbi:hypothetical protein [Streptomyces sp. NPDC101249]
MSVRDVLEPITALDQAEDLSRGVCGFSGVGPPLWSLTAVGDKRAGSAP